MKSMITTSFSSLKILADRLKQYRINAGMTQKDLAERSGVSLRSLQNFEAGRDVQLSSFIRLMNALNLNAELEQLIPDISVRPSSYLSGKTEKKRFRKKKNKSEQENKPFVWGDEI